MKYTEHLLKSLLNSLNHLVNKNHSKSFLKKNIFTLRYRKQIFNKYSRRMELWNESKIWKFEKVRIERKAESTFYLHYIQSRNVPFQILINYKPVVPVPLVRPSAEDSVLCPHWEFPIGLKEECIESVLAEGLLAEMWQHSAQMVWLLFDWLIWFGPN